MIRRAGSLIVGALALAACSGAGNDAAFDEAAELNSVDPALTSALQDQIMVDPALSQQANGDAIRPPGQPYSAQMPPDNVAANNAPAPTDGQMLKAPPPKTVDANCPQCQASRETVTLGGLAARQRDPRTRGCVANLQYSASWAQRLPADLPLYPQARVTEAAGSQGGACALRIVSFSSPQPMQTMLDWYYTKAIRGGYTAEHQLDGQEHILGGTRERDQAAYVLFLSPRADGGTDIDMVANNGV